MRSANGAARLEVRLSHAELKWFKEVASVRKETLSETIRVVLAQEAERMGVPGALAPR